MHPPVDEHFGGIALFDEVRWSVPLKPACRIAVRGTSRYVKRYRTIGPFGVLEPLPSKRGTHERAIGTPRLAPDGPPPNVALGSRSWSSGADCALRARLTGVESIPMTDPDVRTEGRAACRMSFSRLARAGRG